MEKKTYQPVARNATAVCRIASWFDAVGIVSTKSKTPGCDLTVLASDGTEYEIVVAGGAVSPPVANCLVIQTKVVNGRDIYSAFDAFGGLTEKLGYGKLVPVDRGPDLEINPETGNPKKAHYSDDFELVAFRHCDLRRAPNPTNAKFAKYDKIIERVCKKFYWNFQSLCQSNMLEVEDLKTYAMVWAINYFGSYEVLNPTVDDNEKKLTEYLKQKFYVDFVALLNKKNRNTLVDYQTAAIAHTGDPTIEEYIGYETSHDVTAKDNNRAVRDSRTPETLLTTNPDIEEEALTFGRKSAQQVLEGMFIRNHDKALNALWDVIENHNTHPDAKKEAMKWLRSHTEECEGCAKKDAEEKAA
jgi:hypothetical protein